MRREKLVYGTKNIGAKISSYGCSQGDPGGLMQILNKNWNINTKGSTGKTDYKPIGRGSTFLSSNNGYVEYK